MVDDKKRKLVELCNSLEEEARSAVETSIMGVDGNRLVSTKIILSNIDVDDGILREIERLKEIVHDANKREDFDVALHFALEMKKIIGNRNPEADKLLTEIYTSIGDFENAKKHLSLVFSFCQYDPKAYLQYAKILYKTGNYSEVIKAVNMSFLFNGNNKNVYANTLLVASYFKIGLYDLAKKRLDSIKKKYSLPEFLKFCRCCEANLNVDEISLYLPIVEEVKDYNDYALQSEEILDTLGISEFNNYISNLNVSCSVRALLMINAAKLCEERKLGNLSSSYITSARALDDGTINIKKYSLDTEKRLRFLKSLKRGVK